MPIDSHVAAGRAALGCAADVSLLLGLLARIANAAGLLLVVMLMNFLLIHLAPGDPALVIAGEMGGASPQVLAGIRAAYGLDLPLPVQWGAICYAGCRATLATRSTSTSRCRS